jgi:hypothetical protein
MNDTWQNSFKATYDKALALFRKGNRRPESYFTDAEVAWLASIGCKPGELYDIVEDYRGIDWETALLITSVRRDYYLSVDGCIIHAPMTVKEFPAKGAKVDGIPWLPRLIMKARAKLRGRLPKELMYCCGGDRAFFSKYNIHPAGFLRLVWRAGEDERKIVEFVKSAGPGFRAVVESAGLDDPRESH